MTTNTFKAGVPMALPDARQTKDASLPRTRPRPRRGHMHLRGAPLQAALAVGLAVLGWAAAGLASSPTLQLEIQRSTNRYVVISWSPPQATLQCLWPVKASFTNVLGATPPYWVDTRLQPAGCYRVSLPTSSPTLFVWSEPQAGSSNLVFDWYPRNWQFQESTNFQQWQSPTNVPPTGRYRRSAPLEPVPGSAHAGMRAFRTTPGANLTLAPGSVYSVNILGYANYLFEVGRPNFFSFVLSQADLSLNTLLPLPPEADGTTLLFYDSTTQSYGPACTFLGGGMGWVDELGRPAVKDAGQSAALILPQNSLPGATTVAVTSLGEFAQGNPLRRVLPPGPSLNGPLAPLRGGITTVHQLHPRDGNQVLLFNPATQVFDSYEFFFMEWYPAEPVIGPGDAFFFINNNGPLDWTRSFIITP